MGVADVFADTGMVAAGHGQLPDALAELAIRLDLSGHGDLLTDLAARTCWVTAHGGAGCRCSTAKKDPDPRPVSPPPPPPKQPPPPPPPPPPGKSR